MKGRVSAEMVAAYLREIGIDYIPVPRRDHQPVSATAASPAKRECPPGEETLEEIRNELASCRGCALCPGRKTVVFGVGNPGARLMFVGEGPGEEEDRKGEPFVGAAGRRLNQWIARIGLSRDDVYIANIVKCRPPGNRAPLPAEAAPCLPFLERQIRAIRPVAICTLGGVALQFLIDSAGKITRDRGKWREFEGIPVLPTYHPAYILRNQTRETEVFSDFDLLAERLRL